MAILAFNGDRLTDSDGNYLIIPDLAIVPLDMSRVGELPTAVVNTAGIPSAMSRVGEMPTASVSARALAVPFAMTGIRTMPKADTVRDMLWMVMDAEYAPEMFMNAEVSPELGMLADFDPEMEMLAFAYAED